jgi:hypothetical protein
MADSFILGLVIIVPNGGLFKSAPLPITDEGTVSWLFLPRIAPVIRFRVARARRIRHEGRVFGMRGIGQRGGQTIGEGEAGRQIRERTFGVGNDRG